MVTIFKYPFNIKDVVEINMPKNAKLLSLQVQHETACLWFLVDTEMESWTEKRTFHIYGTGHPIKEKLVNILFIGTVQLFGGGLVWHVFEKINKV